MTTAKTKMTIERSEDGLNLLVMIEADFLDGEQFFKFAVRHAKVNITLEELERSVIAQVRDMLGSIVGIGDRTP